MSFVNARESVSISPIHDAMGRTVGASKIARDMAPQRRAEAAPGFVAQLDDAAADLELSGATFEVALSSAPIF